MNWGYDNCRRTDPRLIRYDNRSNLNDSGWCIYTLPRVVQSSARIEFVLSVLLPVVHPNWTKSPEDSRSPSQTQQPCWARFVTYGLETATAATHLGWRIQTHVSFGHRKAETITNNAEWKWSQLISGNDSWMEESHNWLKRNGEKLPVVLRHGTWRLLVGNQKINLVNSNMTRLASIN